MIRDLAKKLSAFSEFSDTVLAELKFQRGTFAADAQVMKVHASMALVRASSSTAELSVKLIRPRSEVRAALGCRIQSSENIWRVFTATEVFDFVTAVGDTNKIHRFNPPIVPGLLLLEVLLTCADFAACRAIKLKFKNFITAGEPLTLQPIDDKFEICSAGVRKVLITVG